MKKGPETICDLGAGVPNHSELELRCGVPHGLGGVPEAGGLRVCVGQAGRLVLAKSPRSEGPVQGLGAQYQTSSEGGRVSPHGAATNNITGITRAVRVAYVS